MLATIIGADGGMGRWLKCHLIELGYAVHGFDTRRDDDPSRLCESDLVVISVPIDVTRDVIRSISDNISRDTILMEIASLKKGVHGELVSLVEEGITSLCVHPMWGPSTDSCIGKALAVIPVLDTDLETSIANRLFPGASIIVVDAGEHDRLMSIILSLPYLVNLALAGCLVDEDLVLLRRLSGTSFASQYVLTQSIVNEDTKLVESLLGNQYVDAVSKRLTKNISNLLETHGTEEFIDIHEELRSYLNRDPISNEMDKARRDAYAAIQRHWQ